MSPTRRTREHHHYSVKPAAIQSLPRRAADVQTCCGPGAKCNSHSPHASSGGGTSESPAWTPARASMSLPMADPKPADDTPPAVPDRPRHCGRSPSGRGELRRRFARKPTARREIPNESSDFRFLRTRHAHCSVVSVDPERPGYLSPLPKGFAPHDVNRCPSTSCGWSGTGFGWLERAARRD